VLEDDASQPEDEEKEDDAAGIGEATKDCEVIAVDGEEGESESPVGESATDGGIDDEDAHSVADADSEGDGGMEELNTPYPLAEKYWNEDRAMSQATDDLSNDYFPKRGAPIKESTRKRFREKTADAKGKTGAGKFFKKQKGKGKGAKSKAKGSSSGAKGNGKGAIPKPKATQGKGDDGDGGGGSDPPGDVVGEDSDDEPAEKGTAKWHRRWLRRNQADMATLPVECLPQNSFHGEKSWTVKFENASVEVQSERLLLHQEGRPGEINRAPHHALEKKHSGVGVGKGQGGRRLLKPVHH
jgi:hypothetical protein